ncbi:MAG: redoxin domain-containing protein [Kaiparowitsia implicata GSE-PSE-MK54-09C]|jgi:thioredoxin 1|nr:redoxin domain-containing protein [Kaiparowitsia implicata GSE-PSE-MK54-09C]
MMITVHEENFSKEVLASDTPVLVNFWAPWCGLCRLINPLLNSVQAEWGDDVKLVSINADDSLRLANTYQLKNLPTVLLIVHGEVMERFDGFHSREDIANAADALRMAMDAVYAAYSLPTV